jgi:small ligand-binding sensory domain FIST
MAVQLGHTVVKMVAGPLKVVADKSAAPVAKVLVGETVPIEILVLHRAYAPMARVMYAMMAACMVAAVTAAVMAQAMVAAAMTTQAMMAEAVMAEAVAETMAETVAKAFAAPETLAAPEALAHGDHI